MGYKMVVSDLDGTLLNSQHKISQYTVDTIKKLSQQGILFVIATGRHYKDAKYFFDQLGVGKYLISGNGSFVHNDLGEIVKRKSIPKDIIKELLNHKVEDGTSRSIYMGEEWYTDRMVKDYIEFHKESKFAPKIDNLVNFNDNEIEKVFFIHEDREVVEQLERELRELELAEAVNIATSQPTCLEVMDRSVNKGEALKELLKFENIAPDEVIAFGDALNDKEMLEYVGKGIIMGNGDEKLKELLPECSVIGSSDIDSEAKFLNEFFNLD